MLWRISRTRIYICIYTHIRIYTHTNALANLAYCLRASAACASPGAEAMSLRTCATWLIYLCDMTHLHAWHYSFICILPRHDSFTCVTWPIHTCDMTHQLVWHDSFTRAPVRHGPFICVTWLIYLYDMTCVKDVGCHNGVWKWCVNDDSLTRSRNDSTSIYVLWYDSFVCVTCHERDSYKTWLDIYICSVGYESFACVTWLLYLCDTTPLHVWQK